MIDQNAMLYDRLKSAKQFEDIMKAVGEYHKVNDFNCQQYVASNRIAIVCRQGCVYCCNLKVDVGPYEAFLIANYVAKHFSADKRAKTVAAISSHVLHLSKITETDHLSINAPCPLLSGNICSVYPVRPFACRAYYALDVSSCQYSFENPADLKEKRVTDHDLDSQWADLHTAVVAIFQQLGYDTTHNELGTALLCSLSDSKAQKRWMNKKKVFVGMRTYQDG